MEVKLLTEHYSKEEFRSLEGYEKYGGYRVLRKALGMLPEKIVEEVKASGLRGRGGAGFPTGVKWGFLPKNGEPRFLLCNADEGEPGTFKDRMMMERAPHQLIEGLIVSAYAIQSLKSYIYIRGEYTESIQRVTQAIKEAYQRGYLGQNILGGGFHHDMDVYMGAGAYICGEETAMISSLEGKKGYPKLKPPFPAVEGYLKKPTIVNNVETLAAVIPIVDRGASFYRQYGTEKSPGTKLFSLSGNVVCPGNYELPLGYSMMDLIYKEGGGLRMNRRLKAVIPGGSSAAVLTAEEVERAHLDYESLSQLNTMLGSGAVIVIDNSNCMVNLLRVILNFYHHESCGQCTPCREGTGWIYKIVKSIYSGQGRLQDIELITQIAENMMGRTICALADAAVLPTLSFIRKFRDEFEFYVREGRSKVKEVRYA